jgi:hypothetical protein
MGASQDYPQKFSQIKDACVGHVKLEIYRDDGCTTL